MNELVLDASTWKTKDDVYDSFFRAVNAPAWHGRNLDALRLVVRNNQTLGALAKAMLEDFVKLIHDLAAHGCPVEIRVENTN